MSPGVDSVNSVVRSLQHAAPPAAATEAQEDAPPSPRENAPPSWLRRATLSAELYGVAAAGVLALLASLFMAARHPGSFPFVFVAVAFALGMVRLNLYGDSVSLGPVAAVAAAAIYGPAGGAMAGFATAAAFLARSEQPRNRIRPWFNAGVMTLAGGAAGLPFLFAQIIPFRQEFPALLFLGLMSSLAMYVLNSILVCGAIALDSGLSPYAIWYERFRWLAPQTLGLGVVGTGLAAAYSAVGVYEILAFGLPVAGMQLAWRQYIAHTQESVLELRTKNAALVSLTTRLEASNDKLQGTYRGTLEALVGALDARDNEVQGHSYRVSAYSQVMAERLGVVHGSPEWEAIARGALLHDVGKIGVRDAVLHKPSKLDDTEWVEMRAHAELGFGILDDVEFLRPAAELVRAHHERYDGGGYPRKLRGDEIPLGARIFAVADAFDAMTSDRPYRGAMAPELAVAEITRCTGTQFDPKVVETFAELWPQLWAVRAQAGQMVA